MRKIEEILDHRRGDTMEHLRSVIEGVEIAMLTTVGADGKLFSRPMLSIDTEDERYLWFFAHHSSAVVRSILRHPQVNLAYVQPKSERYVSVAGRAERVVDPKRAADLWVPRLQDYFQGGLSDPDLVLLRVDVETAEYWEQPPNWLMRALRVSPLFSERQSEVWN